MINIRLIVQTILIGICLLLLTACSSSVRHLNAKFESADFLNPNIYNKSSPVVVTIYQLKSPTIFQQANFFALSNNATTLLGADLLDKFDIELRPQQKQKVRMVLSPQANYIGVIAAFRNTDNSQWRQLIPIRAGKNTSIIISLSTQSVLAKLN